MENIMFMDNFIVYIGHVRNNALNTYKDSSTANPTIDWTEGKRYMKVIITVYGSRSVHSFVEISTGDVLKPATWNAPAKHARGNVFNPDCGREALTEFGIKYLK